MLDIILFGIISSIIITILSYFEASISEPENEEISKFIKVFIISFIVNTFSIFVFKNMSMQSIYSQAVEVGLP